MKTPANDHWTIDLEDLGMERTGDALADLIVRCRPPFAICVQGKWGSGKTSLMRYAMARIGGTPIGTILRTSQEPSLELPDYLNEKWREKAKDADLRLFSSMQNQISEVLRGQLQSKHVKLTAIWFNPWQHQGVELPLAALLREIRSQLTFSARLVDQSQKIAQVSLEAGLTIIGELVDSVARLQGGPSAGVGGAFAKVRGIGEAYEKRNFENESDAQRFSLLFEQAVARVLGEDVEQKAPRWLDENGRDVPMRRLVIFIDDLDRCSEENVVQLLESIKLYLNTRYCVFVLGMDNAAVRRAVQQRVPGSNVDNAREYLEKLFQATVHVPVSRDRKAFVKKLVDGAQLPSESVDLLDRLVEPNPRKMKNFVNSLAVAWRTCEAPDDYIQPFVLVHYLKSYHPEVCRLLTYDPKQIETFHKVVMEDSRQPSANADSVRLFFRSAFRHVFDNPLNNVAEPVQSDFDEVVEQFVSRLDRHRGDRAFLQVWEERYANLEPVSREAELVPALVAEGIS